MMDWQHAYRTARRIVRNHEDAEDVAQDALLKMHQHADRFKGESLPSTWATSVVIRTALDHLRWRRRQALGGDRLALIHPRHAHNPGPHAHDLSVVLGLRLSPLLQQALSLYALGGTEGEVADELGVPLQTAKARIHRARKKIAGQLAAA